MSQKEKKTCGARTRSGGQCKWPAGWGTDHVGIGACKLHGGCVPSHQIAAKREKARRAVEQYGLPRDIDPAEALTEELHRTAGHVAWLGSVVQRLEMTELASPVGQDDDAHHPREEPSVWIRLYQAERKHLADVAKTCLDVGIEEREVRLVEEQGRLFANVIVGILGDLGIAVEDPRTRQVVRKHLSLVEGRAEEKGELGQ